MYGPPALGSSDLDTLIHWLGGDNLACALLDITPRTLRRWRARDYPVPQMALKLLWYAGPLGRQAADADLYNEVRLLRSLTAVSDQETGAQVLTDEALERLSARAAPSPSPVES